MTRILKTLVPGFLRLRFRVWKIAITDIVTGTRRKFARISQEKVEEGRSFPERIIINQRINISKWANNKIHNLRLAISTFENLPIFPGEIFSFWHYIGNPTEKAGYKIGINIIKSQLDFDFGGGLCQLSGLLYHLALTASLGIVERYPHSVDLYTDETRYTPLGADATTAFGYKDLRIQNTLHIPICFRIRIENHTLIGALCAPDPIDEHEVKFVTEIIDGIEEVETLRRNKNGVFELLCCQSYEIADHGEVI